MSDLYREMNDHEKFMELMGDMTVCVIVHELCEIMVPAIEGRRRALAIREDVKLNGMKSPNYQNWMSIEYRMMNAIGALEKCGYEIKKSASAKESS